MTDELKPCPFCGGKPQPRLDDCINGKMVENPMFYIACENLGCGVWPEAEGRYETQYDAIVAAWNRRALPTADAGALGAVAMREACLDVYVKGDWDWFSDAHDAMAEIPVPTHAAQLAAALALPEVAAMVDAQIAPLLTADLQAQLADPVAVHANMLRGTIAKPSIYQIMHIYGRDALMRAMDAEKMAALRKEFPNV